MNTGKNEKRMIVRVLPDDCAESPREWDNMATMLCTRVRHTLGDEQFSSAHEVRRRMLGMLELTEGQVLDLWNEVLELAEDHREDAWRHPLVELADCYADCPGDGVGDNMELVAEHCPGFNAVEEAQLAVLPLYLYDHSGVTMNTTGFSCPWDSGQVGYIVCPLRTARETFLTAPDASWDTLCERDAGDGRTLLDRTLDLMREEVTTYDRWLTGDVWGFVVEDPDTGEQTDSCWGFYGRDEALAEGLLAAGPGAAEADEP